MILLMPNLQRLSETAHLKLILMRHFLLTRTFSFNRKCVVYLFRYIDSKSTAGIIIG